MRAVRWQLSGRVQGVGFRYFTLRAALELGIVGWVRNLPDGRVEIEAAGAPPALDAFRRQVEVGPPHARVEAIESSSAAPGGGWTEFEVRY